jgi:isopentenyl-diphosphate Delta-isomerase
MATEREENVVLVDEHGRPIGQAEKRTVHGRSTPRHLGFSCYGFDGAGRLLVTQRAAEKATFPGLWTNTCCGHPAPGEPVEQAVRRRLSYELEVVPEDLGLVLPEFSYRASFGDIEENELCPVFVCRLTRDPSPRQAEVQAWEWWPWDRFLREAEDADSNLSPWARLQAPLLEGLPGIPERRS